MQARVGMLISGLSADLTASLTRGATDKPAREINCRKRSGWYQHNRTLQCSSAYCATMQPSRGTDNRRKGQGKCRLQTALVPELRPGR